MGSGDGKEVHSIVCACFGNSVGTPAALEDLQGRVLLAVEQSGAAAERVVDLEIAFAAIFLNSMAAIECARHLYAQVSATVPLKIGIHLGPLDVADPQIGQRAPLRLARQIAVMAPAGRALVSPLFHHFVNQFGHSCKRMIHPSAPVLDAQGRSIPVFEAHFDKLPRDPERPTVLTAATIPAPTANGPMSLPGEGGFLPADPARREAFLARAERVLADEIGPLAKLIVRKAETGARSRTAFYQQLVEAVPDAGRRVALLKILGQYD